MVRKELLFSITKRDLQVEFFSGTGAGGQYRNKHQNCVRIKHTDSGVNVTGQSNRNRQANIREALRNLVNHPRFRLWHNQKVQEALEGKTVEQIVDEMMRPENLKIECRDERGRWVETEV